MRLTVAARSDIGLKRRANEDFHAVDESAGLFVVADGLGGHVAGRTASELGVGRFLSVARDVGEGGSQLGLLREACRSAHRAILERTREQPELQGMGTTLTALWLRGQRAALAHVGDSRVYLFRDQKLQTLTFDHSVVNEMMFRGELSAEDARVHPYRHVITRALGVGAALEPDLAELATRPGDVFVLCTDGITGPIEDAELLEMTRKANGDLEALADRLIATANQRGGEDNATVILLAT
jgi:serine/threonine protein phosphatase PrpC